MRKNSIEKGVPELLAEVNITPLGDLSLTLIIIIMVVSPMIMQSMIKVHSSKAVNTTQVEEEEKEKPLFVNITDEAIYLNTQKMESEQEFSMRLAKELAEKKDKSVMITAEKVVPHGKVVHILDLSKQSGAGKLSLLKSVEKKETAGEGVYDEKNETD